MHKLPLVDVGITVTVGISVKISVGISVVDATKLLVYIVFTR